MRKEIIFAAATGIAGAIIGYFIGKNIAERKNEKESKESREFRLYPEQTSDDDDLNDFDPEDSEDDINVAHNIATDNHYIPVEDDLDEDDLEAMQSAKEYQQYIEKHSGEITVISPDYEKRSDSVNNVLDMMPTEMLLYFPNEEELWTEGGTQVDIEDFTGNCLYKYGFVSDPRQLEIHILNVPEETHYIVRKELEDSPEELFIQ